MRRRFSSLYRLLAVADKEWIQIRRDWRSLVIALCFPVILLLLFGYALSMDVKNLKMAVLDHDQSALSRQFLAHFQHSEYILLERMLSNEKEGDALINQGAISMFMVIPSGFESRILTGKKPDIQLILDGSDSTSATVADGYVKMILQSFNSDIREGDLKSLGINPNKPPIDIRTRVLYNPELKSRNFIVPGIIVIVMAIISAMITSLTMSREWERGTMETLITTPVRKAELFFGKMLPYIFIAFFDIFLTIFAGYFFFNVPIKGSLIELYCVSFLFLIGSSAMGILFSSATRSQILSIQLAVFSTFLPTFILSGFVFPIANMPAVVRGITYAIPARYLMTYMKGIMLKGIGVTVLWSELIFLVIFAAVLCALNLKTILLKLPMDKE